MNDSLEYSESENETDNDSSNSTYTKSNNVNTKENKDIVLFFTKKELCYYKMIDKFFIDCDKKHITKMIDIIDGKSIISLRILDWFVTKYSKKRIDCGNSKSSDIFDVRISYKSQLKAYKKRYFDPFRRRKKFNYYYVPEGMTEKIYINTTLGQLNFFKWAITFDIITYVEKNIVQITKFMNIANKEEKKKKKIKNKEIEDKIKLEEEKLQEKIKLEQEMLKQEKLELLQQKNKQELLQQNIKQEIQINKFQDNNFINIQQINKNNKNNEIILTFD